MASAPQLMPLVRASSSLPSNYYFAAQQVAESQPRLLPLQDKDHAPEHSNGSRPRPVLEAKLQVSTPEVNGKANGVSPVLAAGGVTATMGGRMAGNASDKPYPGVPHLQGLPENAQQSGVHRLVGVSNAIVTRPKKSSEQVQRQLGSRLLLREPQYQSQAVMSAGKAKSQ